MKINYLDIAVVSLSAIYIGGRLNQDRSDPIKRTVLGVSTGVAVAYFGPELFNKAKALTTSDQSKNTREKLLIGAITGIAGYALSDLVRDSLNKTKENNYNSKK